MNKTVVPLANAARARRGAPAINAAGRQEATAVAQERNTLRIDKDQEAATASPELLMALAHLSPFVTNASVAQSFASKGGDNASLIGITETVQVLNKAASAVNSNDLKGLEAMLTSQAMALNVMFSELARRAASNMGSNLDTTETYLRLAFKAQAQSRATVEAIGELKNPPAVFANQANFAAGHQQVNNAPAAFASAPNELLKGANGNGLDSGETRAAGGADPHLATMGKVNRPAKSRGQAASKQERIPRRGAADDARDQPHGSAVLAGRR